MALWDLLKNIGNRQDAFADYAQNMPALVPQDSTAQQSYILPINDRIGIKSNVPINAPNLDTIMGGAAPTVTGLQLSDDGMSINQVNTPSENKGFKLSDALLGRQAAPTDNVGTLDNGQIAAGISENPRVGGLFRDLTAGMEENYNNKFDINNWQNNDLEYGRKKGAAYRIGEGLGSFARALNGWAGDSFIAGTQGLDAAIKRQNARTGDKLYRQQLKDNYGFTDEQLNNLNGYISKDDFNTLSSNLYKNQALQVRRDIAAATDNTKRANMIMQGLNNGTITPQEAQLHMANYGITFNDLAKSNASRNADMNAELLPYKKYALQMAPQIAMGNLGLGQARLAYQRQQDAFDNALKLQKLQGANGLSKADQKAYNDNMGTLADINAGLELIDKNPDAYSPVKGITPSWLLNYTDPKGIPTRTQIDNITAVYRKWLTGAQMSDAERKAYERFLPAPTDNAVAVKAKLQGMRDSIERKNNILMQNAKSRQINVNQNALQEEMKRRGLL
ncbi:hypothetical protein IKP85_06680 [bacterium]|nr:hypothetical protein [bacterium]